MSDLTQLDDLAGVLRASVPLAMKAAGDDGMVEGYASTFGGEPDMYGDVIAAGAFAKSLARHAREGSAPAMLWGHDQAEPIGRWLDLKEDSRGLFVRGRMNLQAERGKQAHTHVKAGDVSGFSIGYRVPPGGGVANADGTRTLKEVDVLEVSVVAVPANRHARITGIKSLGSQRELERLLHETGLPKAAAIKLAAGGWPALSTTPSNEIETFADRLRAAALELKSLKG